MSASQHQAIAVAVAALLLVAPALSEGRVLEGRDFSLPVGVLSQIQVFLGDSVPESTLLTGAPVDWTTDVNVVIKARRSLVAALSAEAVADALWFDAWARVMAAQSLGGLVQSLVPSTVSRDRDEADTDVHVLTWLFQVTHRTTSNSLA